MRIFEKEGETFSPSFSEVKNMNKKTKLYLITVASLYGFDHKKTRELYWLIQQKADIRIIRAFTKRQIEKKAKQ